MGSSSGLAGMKCLVWLFRGVEFCCCVVVLGIYSFFLATLGASHSLAIPTDVKAVEGIAAVGTVYSALGVLLVCCCAGHSAPSFISMIFDIVLAAAFIYVAVANRAGTGSCSSGTVNTVYGSGDAGATPSGGGDGIGAVPGVTSGARLPTFQSACTLEMICLAVSCVATLFFIVSVFLEIKLNRDRYRSSRPIRDADGEYISKSGHYGDPPQRHEARGLGVFRRFGTIRRSPADANPDMLPAHQQLSDMQTRQVEVPTWGEVSSVHNSDQLFFNDGESRDEHGPPVRFNSTTAPQPAAEEYNEGKVGEREYGLYGENGEEERERAGKDESEVGRVHKQRENKAARIERFTEA